MTYPLVRLDECSKIVSGATPSTGQSEYWNGDIFWVTPADLSKLDGPTINGTPRTITQDGLASCATELLPPNSVLFSSRAPIGHVAITTVPMATNQGFKSFVPNPDKLDAGYLYHWLRGNRRYLEGLGNGATFKEVSKAVVSRIQVPLPPLVEQRRIASILDQTDDLRRKRRVALERLKDFSPSLLNEMLREVSDVAEHTLAELIRHDDRINYGVVQPGPETEGGIPLIRVENVVDEDFSPSVLKHISPQIEAQYSRSRLRGDEILVACVGSIGAVALIEPDQKGFNIARAVARIPVDPTKADRIFVAEYLKTPRTQAYFRSETRAVAQPTLNIKQLCETRLLIPPLSVQRGFSARVAEFDRLRVHHRVHLAKLDALFVSLQHRAFRDEL